jgi:UDP-N-acetylmuramate dehydrogenase
LYFLGVPGTVGGAIFNNAHYLEDLIGDHVSKVKIATQQGKIYWVDHDDCDFEYDHSRFQKSQEIILEAEFCLKPGSKIKSMELISKATRYRAQTQPLGLPSSGCIFQNVPNTASLKSQFPAFTQKKFVGAGFLIDQAGLKGTKVGGISISHKHAAFFVNDGAGTSQDVEKLLTLVKKTVKAKFGVSLKEEVFFLN